MSSIPCIALAAAAAAALCSLGAHGRAVNISGAWFLPQEKFPLFYRYFEDKVTWNEARDTCDRRGANLISLERGDKMDAVRAYLTELDVSNKVWIALRKDAHEKYFSWTQHGARVAGDGYWLRPNPESESALCSSLDPAFDFRWISFHCGGPETASFVCELRVPEWARKDDGCMLTELPSLSITYEPELGVVELISDCGLAGTRRIVCKGRTKKEDLVQQLSCDEDPFTDRSPTNSTTKASGKDGVTQTTWTSTSTERQTRHRRSVGPTATSTAASNGSVLAET